MVATKAGAAKSAWVAYLREAKAAYQAQKRDAENDSLSSTAAKRARGSNPRDSRGRFTRAELTAERLLQAAEAARSDGELSGPSALETEDGCPDQR